MTIEKQCPICLSKLSYNKHYQFGAPFVVQKYCPVCGAPIYFANAEVLQTYDYDFIAITEYHQPIITWEELKQKYGVQETNMGDMTTSSSLEDFVKGVEDQIYNLPKKTQDYILDQLGPTTNAIGNAVKMTLPTISIILIAIIIFTVIYFFPKRR